MSKHVSYVVSAHGNSIKDDYIILPPGFRVIQLCTYSLCPAAYFNNFYLYKLLYTLNENNFSLVDNLDIINNIVKFDDHKVSLCVYSGNIDDKFINVLGNIGCSKKQLNKINNISFSADNGHVFRDGIYKAPLNAKIIRRDNKNTVRTSEQLKIYFENTDFHDLDDANNFISIVDPEAIIIKPSLNRKLSLKVHSPYWSFHTQSGIHSVNGSNMNNLRDLINSIKSLENYDNQENMMVTIIISSCVGNTDEKFKSLCNINLDTYIYKDINYLNNDGTSCITTLEKYDIAKKNNFSYKLPKCISCNTIKLPLNKYRINNGQLFPTYQNNNIYQINLADSIEFKNISNDDIKKTFKDVLTNFITKHFIKEENTFNRFLYIVYENINNGINYYCSINNLPNNSIKLFYKGGNILRNIYKNFIKEYPESCFENMNIKYSQYFKKSDIDYSIIIDHSLPNWENIYKDITNIVFHILRNIRNTDIVKELDYYDYSYNLKYCYLMQLLGELNDLCSSDTINEKYHNGKFDCIVFDDLVVSDNDAVLLDEYLYDNDDNNISPDTFTSKICDFYIHNNNNTRYIYNFKDQCNTCFASINDTIDNTALNNNNIMYRTRFNLARLKLNFLALFTTSTGDKIKFNLNGELIDVSISHREDTRSIYLNEHNDTDLAKYGLITNNINMTLNILCETIVGEKTDLETMLFQQQFLPWNIQKYEKRINRLIVVYMILILKLRKNIKEKMQLLINVFSSLKNISQNKLKTCSFGVDIFNVLCYNIILLNKNYNNDQEYKKFINYFIEGIKDILDCFTKLYNWLKVHGKYDEKYSLEGGNLNKYKYLKYKNKYIASKK
ncbi:hypothetical protein Hokovirus_1_116 [Hokovirus HKV1]|uniref:Uncharacterized protein n=1 Tax=Hokovirus HKV1 TaxID=1977638 RepID=A0A1V0SET6_9VIRU|nr:hypothetical protein Hokovirus_1_116 [Hokovirus HKV1]